MKRARTDDAAEVADAWTYLIAGGCYVDNLHEVETYPAEDSTTRSLSVTRRRGGNASTTSCVLAQLVEVPDRDRVHWMGVVPASNDADTVEFAMKDMHDFNVDTSLREKVEGDNLGLPSSTIIVSRSAATRTIISSRRGMRELSPEHFGAHLPSHGSGPFWIHLEGRQFETVSQMVKIVNERRIGRPWTLSIEIEKPAITQVEELLVGVDVAFFSREWVEKHADAVASASTADDEHIALRTLRGVLGRCSTSGRRLTCICAWGSHGAFAIDSSTSETFFEPAAKVVCVKDTTGAGDTFIGACIAYLSATWLEPTRTFARPALSFGCAIAGQKVSQDGFAGLRAAFERWQDETADDE